MNAFATLVRRSRKLLSRSPHERALARLEFWLSVKHRTSWLTQRTPADYLRMQQRFYELAAAGAQVSPGKLDGDLVVGWWQEHDKWSDYETFLLKYVPAQPVWTALEYGCGPGRNIRRFSHRFSRIDGVDISRRNLSNAQCFLSAEIPPARMPRLFLTGGSDTADAPENTYDFCFSTICLQHICVWKIRYAILSSLFRILRPGGRISIQMGFGPPADHTVPYSANHYAASGTNSVCDVTVETVEQPQADLQNIGFVDFEAWIRPPLPTDFHSNWIFFPAVKPG